MSKYGNRKITIDGITFDSKKEGRMYSELKLLERAGEITDLKLQPKYTLVPKYTRADGTKVRAMTYSADFSFYDNKYDRQRVIDCKGFKTQAYKLKKKLFNYMHREDGLYLEEQI